MIHIHTYISLKCIHDHVLVCNKRMYYVEFFTVHNSQGFNVLMYGLGSKRTLIEDLRTTMLKDLSHVVVNGYFPSLTIKQVC